jgi:superfamily II DNA/RNA helicase
VHRVGRVGRADRTGLAISLVATGQEKVWFHTHCKGKDSGCRNTKLLDDGGCCIWYNEIEYLKAVEKIAGRELTRMDPITFRLPDADGGKYGLKRGEADHEEVFKSTIDSFSCALLLSLIIYFVALSSRRVLASRG